MSTNKSENLNLHLWEPADDFIRSEFNENFSAIDTAVAAEVAKRAAEVAELSSPLPYAIGTYVGKSYGQAIELDFTPSAVLINGGRFDSDMTSTELGLYF